MADLNAAGKLMPRVYLIEMCDQVFELKRTLTGWRCDIDGVSLWMLHSVRRERDVFSVSVQNGYGTAASGTTPQEAANFLEDKLRPMRGFYRRWEAHAA